MAKIHDYGIGDLHPVIEYVDPVYKNPCDANKVTFKYKGNPTTVIKWCRRNFGERGDGWNFSGGFGQVEITIWSSKLITMYELWQN